MGLFAAISSRRLRREEAYWDGVAARQRRMALAYVRRPAWWESDGSYPWCDLPRLICGGAISLDEVLAAAPDDRREPLRRAFEANMRLNGCRGAWDGTLEYRREMLSWYADGPPTFWGRLGRGPIASPRRGDNDGGHQAGPRADRADRAGDVPAVRGGAGLHQGRR